MKKVTDLRPCDNCGGPVRQVFYLLRCSLAIVNVQAVNEFMGMHQFFGGRASAALVENFSPSSSEGVMVAGDKERSLMTEIVLCADCYMGKPIDLPMLTERIHERSKASTAEPT